MPRTHHTLRCATVPYPWQIQENLNDVLDVDVPLLASIEHQMLEVLHWSFYPILTPRPPLYPSPSP